MFSADIIKLALSVTSFGSSYNLRIASQRFILENAVELAASRGRVQWAKGQHGMIELKLA